MVSIVISMDYCMDKVDSMDEVVGMDKVDMIPDIMHKVDSMDRVDG